MPVPHDIGPVGRIEGRIVGLHAMGNLVADAGPLAAEKMLRTRALKKKAAKDHNDQPVSSTVGTELGKPVRDVSWIPQV